MFVLMSHLVFPLPLPLPPPPKRRRDLREGRGSTGNGKSLLPLDGGGWVGEVLWIL